MTYNLRVRFTKEDKEEFKKITLEELYNGSTLTAIANRLGVSTSSIEIIRDELVLENLITKEEIAIASENRKKEEKENDPNRKKVLEGLMSQI